MAPGQGGKRKRSERSSWSGDPANADSRPSPHRPGTLNMASHGGHHSSPPREPHDGRDRSRRPNHRGSGGGRNSRRGSYDHQHFPGPQPREQAAISPSPSQQKDNPETTRPNGEPVPSQATPSPAPNTPTAPSQRQLPTATEPVARPPPGPPPPYDHEYVTDEIVQNWSSTGKKRLVENGRKACAEQDITGLSAVYQELIRSAIYDRLRPAEAGSTIKEIIGDETAVDDVDMEASEIKPSNSDFDTRSLFLDTLSIVTDTDTTNPALKPLVFATAISPDLMRLQLETPLLQSLGLVRETFTRMGIRKQTNLLYRQSNYNLLREESEGYSKLLTELFTTSNNEPPTSEAVGETFERVKAMIGAFDMDVGRVLDVTLDVFAAVLVKQFRFFVKLLRVSSWWPKEDTNIVDWRRRASGLPNWALPGSAGWATTDEERIAANDANHEHDTAFWDRVRHIGIQAFFELGRKPLSDDEKAKFVPEGNLLPEEEDATWAWIKETGTLPPSGNRVAAQLLGFKLRFYSSTARSKSDSLPDNLIYLAALLIKVGFISLRDLYAHLWRPDDSMDVLKDEKMTEKAERERAARPGGGVNALMMAGALSDDTLPAPRMREADSRLATPSKDQDGEKQSSVKGEEGLPDPSDQKVLLLKSLLAIGAIPEALFVISKFPWLMDGYPELPEFIHRILHHSLSKVYTPLRPLASKDVISTEHRILSSDQAGVAKGQIRLAQQPPRRSLRWAQLDKEDTDGTDYRFYWEDWADNIPICQSVDDVFTLCSSFLNLSGHKIGQDASLLTKLARIGKDSLTKDVSEENKNRWRELCKRLLLPSVSLTNANPGVVNEVFDLISFFPRDVRYNMYAEWYSGQTSRLPEIKSAFDQARAETKDVLKRLSKTNVKPMARALAKIAYANPGIVINVAISQIESYENLIEVVVECARYFTYLGYDILTWSLINSLGQKGRSRVQEGGLLTSRWLNALSTFAGRTFKRYSVMDPAPLLQYVVEQLRHNNSTDLIVLEQIVSSMAGIITDNNFNDNQIQAMAGGELLQSQTILQLLDKRHESTITAKRLIKSLTHTRLAGQLLVAIAQERLTCVFNESSSELKLLGNIYDEIHRILTQYLDLLRSNLTVDEFDSFVPNFASLVKEFGIQPEVAFWIRRVSISRRIADVEQSKQETQTTAKEAPVSETNAAQADRDTEMEADDDEKSIKPEEEAAEPSMDVDKEESQQVPTSPGPLSVNPVMQELIEDVKNVLPAETWDVVGAHFYATFWQLSLYDVHIPGKSYEDEIDRLKRRVATINSDRSDLSMAGSQRKEREKKQISQLQERILEENKNHLKAYDQTRKRLQKEKDQWFAGMRRKHDALNTSLLEQCFIPRLLLSPIDAFFSFKMLKLLHSSGTPNIRTVGLIDQLFREQRLSALIFLCTSKEADNLGRFLNEILRDLSRWHADKNVYEKEAFGAKRDLPGFAKTVDPEGVPIILLEFEDFRRLLYKWHRLFSNALKACLSGGEYMHIRNGISVLKAVVQHFPAVNWIGRDMLNCVNHLSKNDERDDVKIPAASLIGDLNRREKKWMLPQAFNLVKAQGDTGPSKSGSQGPGTPQLGSSMPTALNGAANEFRPSTGDTADSNLDGTTKMEVEDGEIEDAKMTESHQAKDTDATSPSRAESTSEGNNPTAIDSSADTGDRPVSDRGLEPPTRPRPGSRTRDSGRLNDSSKRQEDRPNPRAQANRPRLSEGNRLPPRPDLLNNDDRPRDRVSDFNPRTRHSNLDHARSFEGPLGGDSRGRGRMNDREFPMRPLPDDPMRGPAYHENRPPRDQDWPQERAGRNRPSEPFHGRDGPVRGEAMRSEKEDRRNYPRPLSPPRSDLPNRPERFPNDRRSLGLPQPPRPDEFPRGPRNPGGDSRDSVATADMEHGRLRPPETPSDIPSGPRNRNNNRGGRNLPSAPVAPGSSNATKLPSPERQMPTGPGRKAGRGGPDSSPAPQTPAGAEPPGIHPDRLKHIITDSPSQKPPPNAMTPPSGPRGGPGNQQTPRGSRGDRNRGGGDKRFSGLNDMLLQNKPNESPTTATPPARGRGSNKPPPNAPEASPQSSNRPPTGPSASQDDPQSRNRSNARGGDLIDDAGPNENRRGGRNNDRDRDRERKGDESANVGGSNRREDRRDRDRNRRSDVGGGGGGEGSGPREEKGRDRDRHGESRENQRRNPGSREEMRRRDRRERDDGAPESGAPNSSANTNENESRNRPSSSMGAPPPPPPPPNPPPLPNEENGRRWNSGGDRNNRSENRDRERERRGDRGRDRDHQRDGNNRSGHRKRGPPNQEDNAGGEGGSRGHRMGGDNKRPRRGQ